MNFGLRTLLVMLTVRFLLTSNLMNHTIKVAAVLFMAAQIAGFPSVLAQPTPVAVNADGPRIKFSEDTFDFGKVKFSDVLGHDFIVTNTGNAPLVISSVMPACGCTVTGTWDREIQPGQTGKIPIQ